MSEARVRVSVTDGTIELEGTESFVSAQLEKFGDSIRAGLASVRKHLPAGGGGSGQGQDKGSPAGDLGDLDDVFAETETGVQILKNIPGDNKSEKMANVGKLLAYGMAKVKNKPTVLFEEVKAACEAHGCYDGSNMAKVLKGEKSAFVFGGKGKKQTIALTKPGTGEVEAMIDRFRKPAASE